MLSLLVVFCWLFPLAFALRIWMVSEGSQGAAKGFGGRSVPRPNVIIPSTGKSAPQQDKFLMMYTCKKCSGRNAQMVSKVAYNEGLVVSTCKHCKIKHLIADNKGLLDLPAYGARMAEYLEQKGEKVQRLSLTSKDLEDNYLIDDDGQLRLTSKMGGQLSPDVTVVEYPSDRA